MVNQPKKSSKSHYDELGKMLVSIYESGYTDRNQTYKMSFIKGVMAGFGGALGATLVLALLIWLLSFFDDLPLLGRLVENIRETLGNR